MISSMKTLPKAGIQIMQEFCCTHILLKSNSTAQTNILIITVSQATVGEWAEKKICQYSYTLGGLNYRTLIQTICDNENKIAKLYNCT